MKRFIFNIPDTSTIKVGDVIVYNGVEHELIYDEKERCDICSLLYKCDSMKHIKFCNLLPKCIFK